ncbi:TatD family hydrolase [Thermosyntropha sp.]|uniref:TatD family hydrolase n=1 Tax=Thermosyntropha sp. TaxID=2740820 RepID=UPI0025E108AE|nr:TatD family hydrolase [Thermosyntropha sp.]MBO8159968.1 TatD family hydrolase [Thermosyntropha sp.]
MLIDTHAHLQDKSLKPEIEDILKRADEAGVKKIVCVGYDYATSVEAVELANRYKGIYAVVGVHPHDAEELNQNVLEKLYVLAKDPKVVAIGEIGLDYYRNLSPKEKQKEAFIEQIKMAHEIGKPVVIHDRDAHQDVLNIIKQEKAGKNGGIMHCYSGHLPMAIELMKQGFYISFAGPVTFNNARKTQEVAANIPLDKMLIETDCPYLTPEPFRGKRNEPAYVRYVAGKIAEIRRKDEEEVAYITSRNAEKIFNLLD